MDQRLSEYLRQLRAAAHDSIEFVGRMSYEKFQGDTKTQRAVTMNLVILGEVAVKIGYRFPEFVPMHPEIAWTAIRGMRDRIAHEYFMLNVETIWKTIETELPLLLRQVESIMKDARNCRRRPQVGHPPTPRTSAIRGICMLVKGSVTWHRFASQSQQPWRLSV